MEMAGEHQKPIYFETRHRVRFRDIDAYGHMNVVHYLTYYADHRFEGMRSYLGLGFKELDDLPIAFHIRQADIEFLRPLYADQEFVIRSHIAELKRSQCYVDFEMRGIENELLSTCRMRVGCVDKSSLRPGTWPPGLMSRFFHG